MTKNNQAALFVTLALLAPITPTQAQISYQQQFIQFMAPRIEIANQEVLLCRSHLAYLHFRWKIGEPLSPTQEGWLNRIAKKYRFKDANFTKEQTWAGLLTKIDELPNSLILAQAALESNWGRSRFATQGHNYFGVWCYTPNCGLIPERRPKGATYEVKSYSNAVASVRDYLLNINSASCYQKVRALRLQLRAKQDQVNGLTLAHGLQHYSQKGLAYIPMIQGVIRTNQLTKYDKPAPQLPFIGTDIENLWWWAVKSS